MTDAITNNLKDMTSKNSDHFLSPQSALHVRFMVFDNAFNVRQDPRDQTRDGEGCL